jgi:chorismate mutase/prephenate dehydratase
MSTFSLILAMHDFTTNAVSSSIETMPDTPLDLEELRRRIDEIDDRLHDLLIERVDIIAGVAAAKRKSNGIAAHQPAREAEIIRRLVQRNEGEALPEATLVRIWRELLAATVRLQGNFAVAVYAPPEAPGFWDLARDQYGSHTPMMAYRSIGQVIRAVTEGLTGVGVLPMPDEEEADPWWRHLFSAQDNAPQVIARLPFGPRGNARTDGANALVIGHGSQQQTTWDRTLIAIENAPDISRGRIFSILSALGLKCTFLAACDHADGTNTLIEIDDFVPVADPRLDRLRTQLGASLYRLLPLGGYAAPLSVAAIPQRPLTTRPGGDGASLLAASSAAKD